MIKPYSQILNEVGNAVDYVRAAGGSVPLDIVGAQVERGKELADLPDDASIEDWFDNELPEAPPNFIRAASVEEFALVYVALGYLHGGIPQHMVDKDIAHEKTHKERADFIGFSQSVFTLILDESSVIKVPVPNSNRIRVDAHYSWWPSIEEAGPIGHVSKLAIGSMVAAPPKPSIGDMARLNAMGYEGQLDVAKRIKAATDPRLAKLLLPEVQLN